MSAPDPIRQAYLNGVQSVVIKLGTQLLSTKDRRLDTAYVAQIAGQIAALRKAGKQVTVVSSGAVGAGMAELNLAARPSDLAALQAVAAVGQPKLMAAWSEAFSAHGLKTAQVLLTYEDIEHRTRFLNLRNTLLNLHSIGAVPIINENDTVSTAEIVRITFGDNDILASLVASALRADLLILLSVVDGLLDAAGKPVRLVQSIEQAQSLVRTEKSALGKGGMNSKVEAARRVTGAGEGLMVADGRMPSVLLRLLEGELLGSFFPPTRSKMSSRSRWIGAKRPTGTIHVDAGAARAVAHLNRSLLPAGVVKVTGSFAPGAVVAIVDADEQTLAIGLSNYSSEEIALLKGRKTAEVRKLLAHASYDEIVHRDNLVIAHRSVHDDA